MISTTCAFSVLQNDSKFKYIFKFFNTLRPRRNRRRCADDILKCIFLNENVWISLKISLKFVPKFQIINIPALVQIMAWRRPGDKPLSEPMIVILLTHICVTRPQWVKINSGQRITTLAFMHYHRQTLCLHHPLSAFTTANNNPCSLVVRYEL